MNTYKRLPCLLVLGATMITSAMAQRPAITQDRDQAGRNFYYQQIPCGGVTTGYCQITFPTVPAGQRLIITYVSVLNQMPVANTIESIDLRILGSSIVAFLNCQMNPGTGGGTVNYTTNEPVFAKFDAGEAPQLVTFTSSSANFTSLAIISGYMITIP